MKKGVIFVVIAISITIILVAGYFLLGSFYKPIKDSLGESPDDSEGDHQLSSFIGPELSIVAPALIV